MSFLPSLPDAPLLEVLGTIPDVAGPLLDFHEALMRGPSPLTVAERELIAAYVSALNACRYCHGVHQVTAQHFGVEEQTLARLLEDPGSAEVDARLGALLIYVAKLTGTPARMTASDAEAVLAAGWDEAALRDAVAVCALFNCMNRLVDGLGITASPDYLALAGTRLGSAGYAGLKDLL